MRKRLSMHPLVHDYDLIVIGTGAGGGVAAHIAARLGKKVAVVENSAIGGECPNFGCVPTKALLQSAEYYVAAHNAKHFGVHVSNPHVNYGEVKKWKDRAVFNTGTEDGVSSLTSEGIDVIRGTAHFLSPRVLSVGKRRFSAHKFLIATGTHDVVPPIEGIKDVGYLTYKDAINLTERPASLFVIGGGAIGCEFAYLFDSFGAKVQIAEFAPRLAFREDPEVGELLGGIFEQLGIAVHTGSKVTKVEKSGASKIVHYTTADGISHKTKVDEILLAAGKAPNLDVGLENAGVEYTKRGIVTNQFMQTSAKHIYAAGDVVGPYMFTHTASYQSRIAAHNMYHAKKIAANYYAIPRCMFVEPEIACVGMTEEELKAKHIVYEVAAVPISVIGRSNTTQQDTGFVKVIASHTGVILGASIVSPRAGEMIHELTLAVSKHLTVHDIAMTVHAFPTWSEAVRVACAKLAR